MQLSMTSGEPYILSGVEQSQLILPGGGIVEIGVSDPITNPITSELTAIAANLIVTLGDAPTWPRFRIDGPITNPQILNQTTGQRVALNYDLGDTEYLMIYPEYGQVLLGNTLTSSAPVDRYGAYDFQVSDWWQLVPGNNDVRLIAAAYSGDAQLTVYYRHAWE